MGTGMPVGVRKNSPCISRQWLFGRRFSMVAEGGGALRFRTWMVSNPVDVSKGWRWRPGGVWRRAGSGP